MTTHLGSQSGAFTGMTELHGSLISMQFLSYLKELTPLCEHKRETIFLARIRLESSKQNPVYAAYTPRSSVLKVERCLSQSSRCLSILVLKGRTNASR
jgi:hypothetical protein